MKGRQGVLEDCRMKRSCQLACWIIAVAITCASARVSAQGQTFATLYNFQGGSDGSAPNGVTVGEGGKLYGTTNLGGAVQSFCGGSITCAAQFLNRRPLRDPLGRKPFFTISMEPTAQRQAQVLFWGQKECFTVRP